MELKIVEIEKPEETNFILGHSHFIKTVEDLYETLVTSSPSIKFGVAFCESSGPALLRYDGNDTILQELAIEYAKNFAEGFDAGLYHAEGEIEKGDT